MIHSSNTTDSKKDSTLNELLRMKRFEQPDEAFWNGFDRELHQKMLQTLVKKDPWYRQLGDALTGRMAQSIGVAAAAAIIGVFALRPVLFENTAPNPLEMAEAHPTQSLTGAQTSPSEVTTNRTVKVELAVADISPAATIQKSTRLEYQTDAISARPKDSMPTSVAREFSMDRIFEATYDQVAYASDSVFDRGAFTTTGVASLIY